MAARQDQTAAVMGGISAVGDIAGSYMAGSSKVQAGTGEAYGS